MPHRNQAMLPSSSVPVRMDHGGLPSGIEIIER